MFLTAHDIDTSINIATGIQCDVLGVVEQYTPNNFGMLDFKVVEVLADNNIKNVVLNEFHTILSSKNLPTDTKIHIEKYFNDILDNINIEDSKYIFPSITNDESLFVRIVMESGYEMKYEIYYDYNDADPDDVEGILHIYKNGSKLASYFGNVTDLHNRLHEILPLNRVANIATKPLPDTFATMSVLPTY